ncbi:uncharacterized protein MYCFIDRAFT_172648 [Pseudocercospora fijiensis CIRAD86]|uniref:Uncharacterized protein n=1 Tax=Pseudocercospora fijiensis (strain CIRAD86) TaxID=383855 RepID=M3BCS6_PSEFD|nr:uncharacterized protein MYCFIDRAFT_172648 [Pseudocercospora fijiensis CIRAD86]EME86973.1 hypothetical protein MYCFIDRAFT_172648 [Pseudocercospora fijiensis CIRAD86]
MGREVSRWGGSGVEEEVEEEEVCEERSNDGGAVSGGSWGLDEPQTAAIGHKGQQTTKNSHAGGRELGKKGETRSNVPRSHTAPAPAPTHTAAALLLPSDLDVTYLWSRGLLRLLYGVKAKRGLARADDLDSGSEGVSEGVSEGAADRRWQVAFSPTAAFERLLGGGGLDANAEGEQSVVYKEKADEERQVAWLAWLGLPRSFLAGGPGSGLLCQLQAPIASRPARTPDVIRPVNTGDGEGSTSTQCLIGRFMPPDSHSSCPKPKAFNLSAGKSPVRRRPPNHAAYTCHCCQIGRHSLLRGTKR